MFEKFTEKAINVVTEAQNIAKKQRSTCVLPEHLLLGLFNEAKGISLKIFRSYDIDSKNLERELMKSIIITTTDKDLPILAFSDSLKVLLKQTLDLASKSGNSTVLYEHLFLSVLMNKNSNNYNSLQNLGFDVEKSKELLERLVQKKTKALYHPEIDETKEPEINMSKETDLLFESKESTKVFERAVSKLSTSSYEILGTEQIISSILEDRESELSKIFEQYGINYDNFEEKLAKIQSRQSEYEGRQIIFTPNAFRAMSLALQTAKELGSSVVLPEHIVLGLLKTKKGVAYDILKELNIVDDDLAHSIIKPIEKQMQETLTILRLAKQEARRLGKNIVGTEMFLLGIIGEGSGIGAIVLSELEINIKDARTMVEKLVGFGNEYFDKEIVFTKRAKRVLEKAWEFAKIEHKDKIESQHMLLSIITEPTSLAMKTLENLGVDAVEIKEGIKKHYAEKNS